MRSHFRLSNAAATACAVSGATSMLTGMCAAQSFIAADYATNSTYAGGWSAGQNGGFGFTAWSTNGTTGSEVQMRMDNSSPFNPLGVAWTLFNPSGSDLAEAGRGFAPLQVGQTIETVIDNPTATQFYRGYTIRLVSGTNNVVAGDTSNVERVAAYTFETFPMATGSSEMTAVITKPPSTTPTPPRRGRGSLSRWRGKTATISA